MIPHSYCIHEKWVIGMTLLGDVLSAVSYFGISILALMLMQQKLRPELTMLRPKLYLLGTFVFACMMTHIIRVITLYYPVYKVSAPFVLFAGLVSLITLCVFTFRAKIIREAFCGR